MHTSSYTQKLEFYAAWVELLAGQKFFISSFNSLLKKEFSICWVVEVELTMAHSTLADTTW